MQWLNIATQELGAASVERMALELLQGSACVPPQLETAISDIPDTPGVYLFFGEGPLPLYIGKSVTLRTRVMSHFQAAAKVAREMRILTEIRRVEWIETAGELGALLLESRLVKEKQPVYNRQLRREKALCSWYLQEDPGANPLLKLIQVDEIVPGQWGNLYGTYRSKIQATDALRLLADSHALCPQLLGLESGKGACFASQIGRCKGACADRESKVLHRARLQMALAQQRLQAWPHPGPLAIREYNELSGRTDIHVFEHWCHIATVSDPAELEEITTARRVLAFDLDTYRLLHKRLGQGFKRDSSVFVLASTETSER
jgi:DNA polymerase-3 subunit epsilon